MSAASRNACVAFIGSRLIASGTIEEVAVAARQVLDGEPDRPLLVFDAVTSEPVELDLRGSLDDVARRTRAGSAADPAANGTLDSHDTPRGPGRPKLGVVAREVTLLPRHWEWLATQPGGASAALRRLVEDARRSSSVKDRVRAARESAYRFMLAMAGNEPGFEEAMRALFAGDDEGVERCMASWPADVRDHARQLVRAASEILLR